MVAINILIGLIFGLGVCTFLYSLVRGAFFIADKWQELSEKRKAYTNGYIDGYAQLHQSIMYRIRQYAELSELIPDASREQIERSLTQFIDTAPVWDKARTMAENHFKRCNYLNLIQYLDDHKPADKMCFSNGECADLRKAFGDGDWEKVIRYIHKYETQCHN